MAPAMIPPKAPDIMPALRKMMKRFDLRVTNEQRVGRGRSIHTVHVSDTT
jgi:hypothetical protein